MFKDNCWSKKRCHNAELRGKLQPRWPDLCLTVFSSSHWWGRDSAETTPGRFLIVSRLGNLLDCCGWLEPV